MSVFINLFNLTGNVHLLGAGQPVLRVIWQASKLLDGYLVKKCKEGFLLCSPIAQHIIPKSYELIYDFIEKIRSKSSNPHCLKVFLSYSIFLYEFKPFSIVVALEYCTTRCKIEINQQQSIKKKSSEKYSHRSYIIFQVTDV